jgi:hypothetical protein
MENISRGCSLMSCNCASSVFGRFVPAEQQAGGGGGIHGEHLT